MKYYRIDNRQFEKGGNIRPQAEFVKRAKENQLKIEKILEQTRPSNKPNRNTILKLFGDCEAAKKFWIRHSNTIIYEVKIGENKIIHKGDYNLIEQIAKTSDSERQIELAEKYWSDECIEDTIIEYFVDFAEVVEIISNSEEERKNTRTAHYDMTVNPRVRVIRCSEIR